MNILEEATKITRAGRNLDYDEPEENYRHIAAISSAILKKDISPRDVLFIMLATKLAREQFKHKRDNLTDLAGYAYVLGRVSGEDQEDRKR